MNRRIVLIDDNVVSPTKIYGLGLGNNIFRVSEMLERRLEEQKAIVDLGPGDGAMLIGPGAFEFLRDFYHFGIRGENYYDCSILRRLGIESGAFVKVFHVDDDITSDDVKFFMSEEFASQRVFKEYKYEIAKSYEEAKPYLDYLYNLEKGVEMGFDYEASGMYFDKEFCITGAAFALAYEKMQVSVFFSFQDIRKNDTKENYLQFRKEFARILQKHQRNIWVFNLTYETQVTWREFGIECEFCDASVYNVLDGLHSKNYSLKWTAQRLLGGGDKYHLPGVIEGPGIVPWDTDFDKLEDALGRLYYVDKFEKGKKKPVGKYLKCSEYDWTIQPEWREVCKLYPDYEREFEELINENFGNPFLNMPSNLLGKYCCLDAFYTVLIRMENKNRFSDLCTETFLNNQRIYSRNSRAGLYTDEKYMNEYDKYANNMMLWGILNMALYRCYKKIGELSKKAANLKKFPEYCKILLELGEFNCGNPESIAKDLLGKNIDTSEMYETGIDEGAMIFKYGRQFTQDFIKLVKESMVEVKFKGNIDSTVTRKKKLLGVVSEKLVPFLGLDSIKMIEKKTEDLEQLLFYKQSYGRLKEVSSQIRDINHIPESIIVGETVYGVEELTEYIMENFYRCSSPDDNLILETELIEEFKQETVFLATIKRDVNKLAGEKNFYKNLGITTPEEAYQHFCVNYHVFFQNMNQKTGVCLWPTNVKQEYPLEVFFLASSYIGDYLGDHCRNIWGSWDGWNVQEDFFKDNLKDSEGVLMTIWTEDDLKLPRFLQMRKMLMNILLYKKYRKILSTYIRGLFKNGSKYVIETPQLIPLREADPNEPGAVKKIFTKYDVMHKETKRSSSGYHTIPSHMDVKKSVTCPVLCTPGTRTGKTATLLSYFDIRN